MAPLASAEGAGRGGFDAFRDAPDGAVRKVHRPFKSGSSAQTPTTQELRAALERKKRKPAAPKVVTPATLTEAQRKAFEEGDDAASEADGA